MARPDPQTAYAIARSTRARPGSTTPARPRTPRQRSASANGGQSGPHGANSSPATFPRQAKCSRPGKVDDAMGTIFKRGSRTTPRFYLQYRDGLTADGRRRYTTHAAKGARTFEDARKLLAQVEMRIAQGLPAFEAPPEPKASEPASLAMAELIR